MPNTLVHLGLQGMTSRLVFRQVDIKWVFLGCIIPDVPWILRKVIRALGVGADAYDLHAYAVVQATLLFCLLLCAAFALLSARPKMVFLVLSVNCVVHLLLDSLEIKWGNGVHLLAPANWQPFSVGWFWPDSVLLIVLSVVSLCLIVFWFMRAGEKTVRIRLDDLRKSALALLLFAAYLLMPVGFLGGAYSSDINSVATLKAKEQRIGKTLYMDRDAYVKGEAGDVVVTLAGEPLRVVGEKRAMKSGEITLRAEFVKTDAIEIIELYEYRYAWRDLATLLGLSLGLLYWVLALVREETGWLANR
ncbi:MAG: hypothetical protein AB8B63_19855 [Granulosicoccus sp.]